MVFKRKVSVVMPVLNNKRYIKESIESILNQTFKDFEFIIVDGGSTDGTVEIIKDYAEKNPNIIPIFSKHDKYIASARNKGLKKANGEYIAVMDGDDISSPDRFKEEVRFMDAHPEVAVVSSWCHIIDEFSNMVKDERHPTNPTDIKIELHVKNVIFHPASIIRHKPMKEVGYYSEDFRIAEDYHLWTKLLNKDWKIENIDKFLLSYRHHPQAITHRHQICRYWDQKAVCNLLGVPFKEYRPALIKWINNILTKVFTGKVLVVGDDTLFSRWVKKSKNCKIVATVDSVNESETMKFDRIALTNFDDRFVAEKYLSKKGMMHWVHFAYVTSLLKKLTDFGEI